MPLPVPEDAMEVDFDWSGASVGAKRCKESQCDVGGRNVLIKPTWKYVQTLLEY